MDEWTKQKVESRSKDRSQSTARSEPLQRTSLVVASKTTNTQAVSRRAPADCAAPRCSANGNTQAQATVRPQRGNNDAPQAGRHRTITDDATPPPNTNNNTNRAVVSQEPTPADNTSDTDDNNEYVGMGSSEEERKKEAEKKRRQASSGTKRPPGTFTQSIYHQGDAVSQAAVQAAHIAVATASDTMYYPGRRDGEPEHCIVCLEYNKFVDPNVDGGRPSGDYTKYMRKKPLVVASGVLDDEQLTRILVDSLAALKHKTKDPKDHVAVRLFRKDPGTALAHKVESYYAKKKDKEGTQPPLAPRELADICDEHHGLQT